MSGEKPPTNRFPQASRLRVWCAPFGEARETVQLEAMGRDVDLTFSTLHPTVGASHLSAWGTAAVAVVASGRSSATSIEWARQVLRDAGLRLRSGVLIGVSPMNGNADFAESSASGDAEGVPHVLDVGDERDRARQHDG